MPYANPQKRKDAARAHYLATKAAKIEPNRQRVAELRQTEQGREILRGYKRRNRAKLVERGLTTNGSMRLRPAWSAEQAQARKESAESIRAARAAWQWYLREGATEEWMRAAYAAKPWRNPRIDGAEYQRLRYAHDASWHADEYERLQIKKRRHRKQIEATRELSEWRTRRLLEQGVVCHYCGCTLLGTSPMRPQSRTLDHVVPLSKGGRHVRSNIVHACLSCNSAKQDSVA